MNNKDIVDALKTTNVPSELVEVIGAALDDLDSMYQMEAEAVSQARALGAAIESANLWTEIAEQRQATIERLEAENAALQQRIGECEGALQVQENMTAALRSRLDACCAELLADAEGR